MTWVLSGHRKWLVVRACDKSQMVKARYHEVLIGGVGDFYKLAGRIWDLEEGRRCEPYWHEVCTYFIHGFSKMPVLFSHKLRKEIQGEPEWDKGVVHGIDGGELNRRVLNVSGREYGQCSRSCSRRRHGSTA